MEEKRKTARVEKILIVQYAHNVPDPTRLSWDTTTVKNISIEGMLFNSGKLFTKNERLQLRFKIPAYPLDHLEATGEVVESIINRTRIKFIDLGEHEKKIIGDYVEYLLRNIK
jgi:hypothetical protein